MQAVISIAPSQVKEGHELSGRRLSVIESVMRMLFTCRRQRLS